jgi:hypothetical protein
MTVDPAQPLKDFQPRHEFFVGIDSDGSVFDTMGIKQRECFCPWIGQEGMRHEGRKRVRRPSPL